MVGKWTLGLRLLKWLRKLLRSEHLTVAPKDFQFRLTVVEELDLPAFPGDCDLHHDSALPNGGQNVMGSAGIKFTDELVDCGRAHVVRLTAQALMPAMGGKRTLQR